MIGQKAGRLRVLVIDDSKPVQRLVSAVLNAEPDIDVVGVGADGSEALELVEQCRPNRMVLDLSMPGMGGAETFAVLRSHFPELPVIIFSGSGPPASGALRRSIAAGRVALVAKPTGASSADDALAQLRATLLPALRQGWAATAPAGARAATMSIDALVIGASTGGPRALEQLLGDMLEPLPVPAFVVQHISSDFSAQLANRLDRMYPGPLSLATDGMTPQPGHVYLAPGGLHLEVVGASHNKRLRVHEGPKVHSCRPSVDILFASSAKVYGRNQLAVVLTGMGEDGLAGSQALAAEGARIVAQDEASSVVWGMPGAVAEAGLADDILSLDEMGPRIIRWLSNPRSLTPTR